MNFEWIFHSNNPAVCFLSWHQWNPEHGPVRLSLSASLTPKQTALCILGHLSVYSTVTLTLTSFSRLHSANHPHQKKLINGRTLTRMRREQNPALLMSAPKCAAGRPSLHSSLRESSPSLIITQSCLLYRRQPSQVPGGRLATGRRCSRLILWKPGAIWETSIPHMSRNEVLRECVYNRSTLGN